MSISYANLGAMLTYWDLQFVLRVWVEDRSQHFELLSLLMEAYHGKNYGEVMDKKIINYKLFQIDLYSLSA